MCSLVCRWRLQSALRVNKESFSIGPIIQLWVVLQLMYPTPPSILTLVSLVQRMQAWPSANSARRLAFGPTESYSVQPSLPLATKIGHAGRSRVFFYWVWPHPWWYCWIIQLRPSNREKKKKKKWEIKKILFRLNSLFWAQ